jgi:hypothetical protein
LPKSDQPICKEISGRKRSFSDRNGRTDKEEDHTEREIGRERQRQRKREREREREREEESKSGERERKEIDG